MVPLGPFDVTEPIGRGGMGTVWRAVHRATGLPVAVKVLHRAALRDGSPPPSFRNEVQAIAALDHPGIVWVFDVGNVPREAAIASNGMLEDGTPYLAMEHASGGTLSDYAPRSWEEVRTLLLDLLDALGHAHARQVIHRDLKPGNVLLATSADARPGWKLTDFGIAAALEETVERSIARGIVGTIAYMSPEQIRSDWREFGPWTDLYALGCMVYRVVGNQRPFRDMRGPALIAAHLTQKPQKLVPRLPVPIGFADWVDVLLQKRPADRFQSAAEAARVLQSLGPPVPIAPDLLPQPLDGRLATDELTTEGPTELVRARGSDPGAVPEDWRRSEVPWAPPRLVGAGLGLFGIRAIPMVGRTEERDALWAVVRQVMRTGRSQVVVLRGAAGVGKTRLARWVGETAHALAGLPYLLGEARPGEPPDQALARPFRRWFRTVRLEDEERHQRLRHALGDRDDLVRALSAMLAPGGEADGQVIEGEARHAVARRVLERIAQPLRPAVLVLDDAHHAPDLLRFARHLLDAQDVRATPVVLVLVVAEEALGADPEVAAELGELAGRDAVLVRTLGPLSTADHERLVQAMLPLDPVLAAELARRTAGNPTHAVQVIRDWLSDQRMVLGAGGWELKGGVDDTVPPMGEVWRERIERVLAGLPADARVLLERAAALGSPVDEEEWQRVCDDPKGTYAAQGRVNFVRQNAILRAELRERLLAAHLAEDTDTGWAFLHEMLRETVLAMARDAGRLGSHHRACARMLLHREGSRRFAERIGRHLLQGDRPEQAIPQLLEGFALRRRTAGEMSALPLLGEVERALRAANVPESDRRWAELATLRAEVFARSERWDDARRWAAIAEERARATGARELEARAGLVHAQALLQRGDAAGADPLLARAEALLREGDDHRVIGELHAVRSAAARQLGDAPRARAHAVLAAKYLTEAGERTGLAEGWSVLAENALREGALAEAERFFERARALHARVGSAAGEGRALSALGEVARRRGDLERARVLLVGAVERFGQAGSSRVRHATLALARVQLARRDWDDARRLVSEVVARADLARHGPLEAGIHAVLVAAAAGLRDWAAFDAHLGQVDANVAALGLRDPDLAWCVELAAARAEAAKDRGRADAARMVARAVA